MIEIQAEKQGESVRFPWNDDGILSALLGACWIANKSGNCAAVFINGEKTAIVSPNPAYNIDPIFRDMSKDIEHAINQYAIQHEQDKENNHE